MRSKPARRKLRDAPALGPRLASLFAGLWLVASVFLWPHTEAQRGSCLVVGLVVSAVAALGDGSPQARFVQAVAAAWLFLSSFALATITTDTLVNDVFVAIVVFASSVVKGVPPMRQARA